MCQTEEKDQHVTIRQTDVLDKHVTICETEVKDEHETICKFMYVTICHICK